MRSGYFRIICAVMMILGLVAGGTALCFGGQKALSLKAAVTEKNVLNLLANYDRDGYYILKNTDPEAAMFYMDGERITDSVDTAVHEMCHAYTGMWPEIRIYRGGGRYIAVKEEKIYPTRKMAKAVPKRLRTFRFRTYVSEPGENLASDVEGVYGLLNEFCAYSWGMHDTVSLYRYYASFPTTYDTWKNYITQGASDRLAYAEFRYYMLFYLDYARTHYPAVYKATLNNRSFCNAYKATEARFAADTRTYRKGLKSLAGKFRKKGCRVKVGEYFMVTNKNGRGSGYQLFQKDYDRLCKETEKGKYQTIHRKLVAGA